MINDTANYLALMNKYKAQLIKKQVPIKKIQCLLMSVTLTTL